MPTELFSRGQSTMKIVPPFAGDARTAGSADAQPDTPTKSAARLSNAIGLTLVAFLPALFWTAIFAQISYLTGHPLSVTALGLVAGAIVLFLTAIYAVLVAASAHSD